MVRTQLYLPEDLYETAKKNAKAKNVSFAKYIRINLQKNIEEEDSKKASKKDLYKKNPFLKYGGKYSWKVDSSKTFDEELYDF